MDDAKLERRLFTAPSRARRDTAMVASIFRLIAMVLSSGVLILACTTVKAQQPKLETHRVGVNTDDGAM
jgi:hypothetical protein